MCAIEIFAIHSNLNIMTKKFPKMFCVPRACFVFNFVFIRILRVKVLIKSMLHNKTNNSSELLYLKYERFRSASSSRQVKFISEDVYHVGSYEKGF